MSGSDLALEPIRLPFGLNRVLARVPRSPTEGWLTVGALAMLLIALAWSVDDPSWIGGVGERTDFLVPIALAGLAVGLIGAKVGWGRWTTHLIGAGFAALVLPLIAGEMLLGGAVPGLEPAALWARFSAAANASYAAWHDLAILDRAFTRQWGHYIIAFGVVLWGTGQYAAYAVFSHRRPLDAVIAVGIVLLANMALTSHDQLQLMVLASLGGLLLLTRSHAFEERATWIRRRIGDPSAVTSLYLRGGSAFIAAAIIGSLTLTATASSKPLQGLWSEFPQRAADLAQWLIKVLPGGGGSVGSGIVSFGPSARIVGVWTSSQEVAFTADFPPDEVETFYWRAAVYSNFELNGWTWGETEALDREALEDVLTGTSDDPTQLPGLRSVTVDVHPGPDYGRTILSPMTIRWVSERTQVQVTGDSAWFVVTELRDGPDDYTVTALVPTFGDESDGLTENKLRAASTDYPTSIAQRYLEVPPGTLGPDATLLLQEIEALVGTTNPFDKAKVTRTILRDTGGFTYDPNVQDLDCDAISIVECFARYRQGYCEYYASTMAMLLRELGVPTRYAKGFLPGDRDPSGHEIVRSEGGHAWVEVYFPGYGWVPFDPTGGDIAEDVPLPSGALVPVTPRPSLGIVTDQPGFTDEDGPSRPPGTTGGGTDLRGGPGPYIAIGILLLISMAGVAYVAWRRGPRRPMEPDVAWRGVLALARRFGFGPQPAQTVFEYAGALGEEVPQVRPELQTVARGKVEVAYGRRILPDDRLRSIADASRRLRVGLLRLAFRRRRRPRGPRAI